MATWVPLLHDRLLSVIDKEIMQNSQNMIVNTIWKEGKKAIVH